MENPSLRLSQCGGNSAFQQRDTSDLQGNPIGMKLFEAVFHAKETRLRPLLLAFDGFDESSATSIPASDLLLRFFRIESLVSS